MKYKGLTELENKVLEAIKNSDWYKDDDGESGTTWCYVDVFAADVKISINACKGVLGSLEKKKIIQIEDYDNEDNSLTVAKEYR